MRQIVSDLPSDQPERRARELALQDGVDPDAYDHMESHGPILNWQGYVEQAEAELASLEQDQKPE